LESFPVKTVAKLITAGYNDFSGSTGWVTRFMARMRESDGNLHKLVQFSGIKKQSKPSDDDDPPQLLHSHPSVPPEFASKAEYFRSFFAEKRAQNELKRRNGIINLDEVPISLDMPSSEQPSENSPVTMVGGNINHIVITPPQKIQFTCVLSTSAAGGIDSASVD
jgi:hypothetical protein